MRIYKIETARIGIRERRVTPKITLDFLARKSGRVVIILIEKSHTQNHILDFLARKSGRVVIIFILVIILQL